jgi:hypothetical protein
MSRNIIARLALIVAAGAAIGACSKVVDTNPLTEALNYGPTCHTALGAYYLPRKLLRLAVEAQANAISVVTPLNAATIADRAQTLCLDYLASPTSEDQVKVERHANGLLKKVESRVVDRTPEIAIALIDTASQLAIAAARQADAARPPERLDLQFDPFVWHELVNAKTALRRFGFCIYVEGHSFSTYGLSPAGIRAAAERWCSASVVSEPHHPTYEFASLPVPREVMRQAVLYRPNIAHKVVILRKRDPYGRGPWTLFQTQRVDMPNVSPVLALGIERAMFTHRNTTVVFNEGVLTDVTVDKGSELVGFVRIPLALAKAIVDVPAQIIQIRITDAQQRIELINAQTALLQQLSERGETAPTAAVETPKSATAREAAYAGACIDAGGPAEVCRNLARSASP